MMSPIALVQMGRSAVDTIRSVLKEGATVRGPHRTIIAAGNFFRVGSLLIAVPIILLVFSIPLFQTGEPRGQGGCCVESIQPAAGLGSSYLYFQGYLDTRHEQN